MTTFQKVMVIDDNPVDLYIAKKILEKTSFADEILAYNSAVDALQYLRNNQNQQALPDVILVDIYMPEMSGFEFMEAYRDLPTELKRHCKVYIISSSIDSKDIRRANEDENVVAFQEKPLSREFLNAIPAA